MERKQRPRSITIISWLFIIFSSISLLSGLLPIDIGPGQRIDDLKSHWYVHLARMGGIVAGVFMLYGYNWARWLLVAWMAFHIVISALHSIPMLLMHAAIFSVLLFFLFRRDASSYFFAGNTR